jgi:hypothetical protein
MAERDALILQNGDELEHINDDYFTYLDRSIFIYGPSKTGKTVTVKHILNRLKLHIPYVLLVCPSELSNNNYAGIVKRAAVHTDVTKKMLEDIWDRQVMSSQTFEKVNNIKVLENLYLKCSHSRVDELLVRLDEHFQRAKVKANKLKNDALIETEIESIKKKYEDAQINVYRKQISNNIELLKNNKALTADEKLTLEYIDFNPRLLLIFDDSAPILKKFAGTEVFKNFLYQGRHAKTTLMVVNHSTHDLPPPLRTNAFISIFGSAEVAYGFFTKSAGNGFTNEQFKEIKKMIDKVYEDKVNTPEKYRKFVWLREGAQTYGYFLAELTKTEWFGCKAFLDLCDQGEKDQTSLDTNNSFYSKFFS